MRLYPPVFFASIEGYLILQNNRVDYGVDGFFKINRRHWFWQKGLSKKIYIFFAVLFSLHQTPVVYADVSAVETVEFSCAYANYFLQNAPEALRARVQAFPLRRSFDIGLRLETPPRHADELEVLSTRAIENFLLEISEDPPFEIRSCVENFLNELEQKMALVFYRLSDVGRLSPRDIARRLRQNVEQRLGIPDGTRFTRAFRASLLSRQEVGETLIGENTLPDCAAIDLVEDPARLPRSTLNNMAQCLPQWVARNQPTQLMTFLNRATALVFERTLHQYNAGQDGIAHRARILEGLRALSDQFEQYSILADTSLLTLFRQSVRAQGCVRPQTSDQRFFELARASHNAVSCSPLDHGEERRYQRATSCAVDNRLAALAGASDATQSLFSPLPHGDQHYSVRRENLATGRRKYIVTLPVCLGGTASAVEQFRATAARCLPMINEALAIAPDGSGVEPIELALAMRNRSGMDNNSCPSSDLIEIDSNVIRNSSRTLHPTLPCETLAHELMHRLGLVDLYPENDEVVLSGFIVGPDGQVIDQHTQPPAPENRVRAFNCRSTGPRGLLMHTQSRAFVELRSNLPRWPRSLLSPAEFRIITQPCCRDSNRLYAECAQTYHLTGMRSLEAIRASGQIPPRTAPNSRGRAQYEQVLRSTGADPVSLNIVEECPVIRPQCLSTEEWLR